MYKDEYILLAGKSIRMNIYFSLEVVGVQECILTPGGPWGPRAPSSPPNPLSPFCPGNPGNPDPPSVPRSPYKHEQLYILKGFFRSYLSVLNHN